MVIQKLDESFLLEGKNLISVKTLFITTFNIEGSPRDYLVHHIDGTTDYTSSKFDSENNLLNIALIPRKNNVEMSAEDIHKLIHLLSRYDFLLTTNALNQEVLTTKFIPCGSTYSHPTFKSIVDLAVLLKTNKLNLDGKDD